MKNENLNIENKKLKINMKNYLNHIFTFGKTKKGMNQEKCKYLNLEEYLNKELELGTFININKNNKTFKIENFENNFENNK